MGLVAVMRNSASWQLLPKGDAAESEDFRPVTKTPVPVLYVKRIVASEV